MSGNEDEVVFPDLAERGEAALEDSDGGDTGGTDSADTGTRFGEELGGGVVDQPEPEPEPDPQPDPEPAPDPAPSTGGSSGGLGGNVVDQPDPDPTPSPEDVLDGGSGTDPTPDPEPAPDPAPEPDPEPAPDPAPSTGGSSGAVGAEAPDRGPPELTGDDIDAGRFVGADISNADATFASQQAERIAEDSVGIGADDIGEIQVSETDEGIGVSATLTDEARQSEAQQRRDAVNNLLERSVTGGSAARAGGDAGSAPDRRTVEVAETGTAAETQITRDETSQPADTPTTAGADVSSIDLGDDDADEIARANAIAEGFRRASTIDEGESDAEEIARANTAGNVLEDTQAAGGDVSSVDVTGEPVAGGQTRLEGAAPPSDPEAAEGAPQPVLGAPGAVESAVGEGASAVGEFSGDLADDVTENIVSPAAGIVGSQAEGQANVNVELTEEGAEVTGQEDVGGLADTTPETGLGRTVEAGVEGFGGGAVDSTLGAPAEVVSAGNTLADAGEFTATQIEQEGVLEGAAESAQAGSNVAVATGEAFADQAQRNPVETLGMLSGGVVGATAFTPVSIRRTDIPTRERTDVDIETDAQSAVRGTEQDIDTSTTVSTATGEQTVRGVEVSSPPIVPDSVADAVPVEGRTLAGTVDGRPTAGTPAVDIDEVDFERAGGQFDIGNTFDPKGPFETEVFAESLRRTGSEEAAQRFATRREIQSSLSDTPSRGDVDAEAVISGARDVPSEQTDEIIEAIDDLDATVKGSATSAAQAEAFRQPRDLDLAVPDEAAARSRLSEALAGTDQSVDDVFDLVEDPDFNDGAFISGGQRAESAITTDEGVAVNPITEEGIRKAQGGTTIRGRGTPDTDVGDADRVDVGPKPTGGDITRQKDIVDLSAISRSVVRQERERFGGFNPLARRRANRLEQQVEDLERQFDPEIEAAREPFQDIPMDPDARRLAADGLGVRRGPDAEIDRSPGTIRTDVGGRTPVPTGAGAGIDASSPSGGADTVLDGTQTILGAGSGSGDEQATDESLFPGAGGSGIGSGGGEEPIRGGPPISGGGADDPSPPSDGPPASPGPRDESGGDSTFGSPPDSPTSSPSSGTTISSSPNTIASGGRPVRSEPDRRDPRVEDDDERERPDTTSLFSVSEDTFSSGILSAEEVLEDQ